MNHHKLFLDNQLSIKKMALRLKRKYKEIDVDDLYQSGCLGFVKAFKRYKKEMGAIDNYAVSLAKFEMLELVRQEYKAMSRFDLFDNTDHLIFSDKKTLQVDEYMDVSLFNSKMYLLTGKQKEAFDLFIFKDMTNTEISKATHTAQSVACGKIKKSIEKLLLKKGEELKDDEKKDNEFEKIEIKIHTGMKLHDVERLLIDQTMKSVGGNKTHAAKLLGISIRTMRNKT